MGAALMEVSAQIQGIDELREKLRLLGADVHKELVKAGKKGMEVGIEAEAKRIVRRRTGDLSRSLTTEIIDEDSDEMQVATGTNKKYAPYLEYGTGIYAENGQGRKTPWAYVNEDGELVFTRGSHPYPFMRPAVDKGKDTVGETVARELEKAIARYTARYMKV